MRAAHAVAVGLRTFVSVDDGLDGAIETASAAGAAIIAAHPFSPPGGHPLPSPPGGHPLPADAPPAGVGAREGAPPASRLTQRFAVDPGLRALVHRFELFNRSTLFGWVAELGLPTVACGDVHEPAHIDGWKTLVPCEPEEGSLVGYLRSPRPIYLARLDPVHAVAA
jgi:hypothetical protein